MRSASRVPSSGPTSAAIRRANRSSMNAAWAAQPAWLSSGFESSQAGPRARSTANTRSIRSLYSDSDLAPDSTIEDTPDGKILGEVLEVVLRSGSHEQKVPCVERIALAVVTQDASTPDDHIDLVL